VDESCQTTTHCNTRYSILQHTVIQLQHTATHCNTLQYISTQAINAFGFHTSTLLCVDELCQTITHCNTHCNTLQYTATHCSTPQHTATVCKTHTHRRSHHHSRIPCLHFVACCKSCQTATHRSTYCNTLQDTTTHYNTLQYTCNILQHTL